MTRISQLIAVVGGVKTDTDSRFAQLLHIAKTPDLFKGHERSYRPRADDGLVEPPQSQKVRATADEVLKITADLLTRQYDVVRTLDEANAGASADVVVNGSVLLPAVPVGHLLWLTRELGTLAELIAALPVLDGSRTWATDSHGVSVTEPVETTKTEKTPYNHVLAPATDKHPAQVQLMSRDEVIGFWSTVTTSGAVSQDRKRELLDRIGSLRDAVKMAREEANSAAIADKHEGSAIFSYLLAP